MLNSCSHKLCTLCCIHHLLFHLNMLFVVSHPLASRASTRSPVDILSWLVLDILGHSTIKGEDKKGGSGAGNWGADVDAIKDGVTEAAAGEVPALDGATGAVSFPLPLSRHTDNVRKPYS